MDGACDEIRVSEIMMDPIWVRCTGDFDKGVVPPGIIQDQCSQCCLSIFDISRNDVRGKVFFRFFGYIKRSSQTANYCD